MPFEKSTNILSHDNSKTNHGAFVIPIKPTIQNYEWSVFHLDGVVEISIDKSTAHKKAAQTLKSAALPFISQAAHIPLEGVLSGEHKPPPRYVLRVACFVTLIAGLLAHKREDE